MEVGTGGNFYKAYHWPGFASGAAYDEKAVLELMRDKAFEIQGVGRRPSSRPPPPSLLPIATPPPSPGKAATGAASYDVERAESESGPWTKVGRDVTDADVQIPPAVQRRRRLPGHGVLLSRDRAQFGRRFGTVERRRPRDRRELARSSTNAVRSTNWPATTATSRSSTDNVRRTQEDAHRIELAARRSDRLSR